MKEPGVWAGREAEKLRTPRFGGTATVRRIVAKRTSDEWRAADGAYEHERAGKRGCGEPV